MRVCVCVHAFACMCAMKHMYTLDAVEKEKSTDLKGWPKGRLRPSKATTLGTSDPKEGPAGMPSSSYIRGPGTDSRGIQSADR